MSAKLTKDLPMYLPLHSCFDHRSKLHFLTIKSHKLNEQKIGYASGKLRKISKDFILVREPNKRVPGYHFHALLQLTKSPSKSWYKKGLHIKMVPLGGHIPLRPPPLNNSRPGLSKKEWDKVTSMTPSESKLYFLGKKFLKVQAKQADKNDHVGRILNYLSKDSPESPVQYEDYIYYKAGRSCVLPHPAPAPPHP